MTQFLWQTLPLREGPGAGGGGAGGAGGGASGGTGAGTGGGTGAALGAGLVAPGAAAPIAPGTGAGTGTGGAGDGTGGAGTGGQSWQMPDGFPDGLKAATQEEFYTKLQTDWKRQRDDIAARPVAPKDASEYTLQISDKLKPFVGDLSKDPVFGIAREMALKAGVPVAQFQGLVGGLYEAMAEKGMLPKPYDPVAERKAFFGDEANRMTDQQMVEKLTPMLKGAVSFLDGLKATGKLTNAGYKELGALLDSAEGFKVVAMLQNELKLPGLTPGGLPQAGGMTRDQLRARNADPRNNPDSATYDAAFARETQELYKKLAGT